MKTLLASFLLFVSTSALALGNITELADNTDWQYDYTTLTWPDSTNTSSDPDGHRLVLTSSMRGSDDVSIEYMLTAYRNDVGAPPIASGWQLSIKFDGKIKPVDISSMSVGYTLNGRWKRLDSWKTVGNDVVIRMNIDNVWALHDGIEGDDNSELEINYRTKVEVETKGFDADSVELKFDLNNGFDTAFHELVSGLNSVNGAAWLRGTAYYRDQPINQLPDDRKPSPSVMVDVATKANIDIDTAYTLSVNQLSKLIQDIAVAKRIEENRIWKAEEAERERLAELERQRVAAEQEAAKQAQSAEMDAYAKVLRNFDWPNSNCDRPSFPRGGIDSNQRARDRFNRDLADWADCLDNAYEKDTRAIRDVVRAIGGDWSVASGTISYAANKKFMPRIRELFEYRGQREDSRTEQMDTMNEAILDFNMRQDSQDQKEEFWDGINDSLDNMSRDMDRMNKQRQQQWNNQIYITPGYY